MEGDAGLHPREVNDDPIAQHESLRQLVELGYLDASALEGAKGAVEAQNAGQLNLAIALMDSNQPGEAAKIFRQLHERFPGSAAITIATGRKPDIFRR